MGRIWEQRWSRADFGRYKVQPNVAGWTLKSATRLYVLATICEPYLQYFLDVSARDGKEMGQWQMIETDFD